jgi:dTDP-4-amino-4,6-dideoxygalactose transaminase
MEKIQMVDLQRQYATIKEEIDQAIHSVIESARFIKGPEVLHFAEELATWLGVKHVIPCANGTDALQIAMMALGLKPGDEVITASFTYVATAEVIGLLGLTPVLVDVDPKTFNIDVNQLAEAIGPKTKAIVPVHLFGQSANMEPIMQLAKQHALYVIEDTAQAIGSKYTFSNGTVQSAGTIGHFGTTSFFPSKNLGCYGDGGALMTNDDELAKKAAMIANHGQSVQYVHDLIGVNSRLDALQAAILRVKLKNLDQYTQARQLVAKRYNEAFQGLPQITTPYLADNSTHVYHQYTLQLNGSDREEMKKWLAEQGIPSMVYYPLPLHHQKAFSNSRYEADKLKITEDLCSRVLSLPMSPNLDTEQQNYIIQKIKEYLK